MGDFNCFRFEPLRYVMYFDAAVVFVTNFLLLFRFAMVILRGRLPRLIVVHEVFHEVAEIYPLGATGTTAGLHLNFQIPQPYPHQGGGQILPTITEVATKFSPWLRPCYSDIHQSHLLQITSL